MRFEPPGHPVDVVPGQVLVERKRQRPGRHALADREVAGRVAEGYMANLVIVEGELFAEKTSISEVWIDGRRFELAKLVPPEVDPAGTWNLVMGVAGMDEVQGDLVLTGDPARMEGSLRVMNNTLELREARVSGKRLNITVDTARLGTSGTITINLDIEGDSARGTGSGPFGEFTVRGTRVEDPDEEART